MYNIVSFLNVVIHVTAIYKSGFEMTIAYTVHNGQHFGILSKNPGARAVPLHYSSLSKDSRPIIWDIN